MRLIDYFPEASISIKPVAKNWQEAIDFSMSSLLANHYVNASYIQAIIFWLPVWRCLMLARNAAR